jgi:hypothetical protein
MVSAMKALLGVAVFGLVPVPPMPTCDALADSRDDRSMATEDMRKSQLEPDANATSDGVAKPKHLNDDEAALTSHLQRG